MSEKTIDDINHPVHYTSNKVICQQCHSQVECIDITRHMTFNLGNVIKYIWRHKHKNGIHDLKKAFWYLGDEITRLEKEMKE